MKHVHNHAPMSVHLTYEIYNFSKRFLARAYKISDFYRDFQIFLTNDLPLDECSGVLSL